MQDQFSKVEKLPKHYLASLISGMRWSAARTTGIADEPNG
jgi:hypothetical protein